MNIGEEIVSVYLQYIRGCEFIQQNLYTPDVQGEIDVVGINLKSKELYVCEVAIHLTTGLRYVKEKQPNNVNKLIDKFSKDIEYAQKYFPDYTSAANSGEFRGIPGTPYLIRKKHGPFGERALHS